MQAEAKPRKTDSGARTLDTIAEAPFYIPSTGPSARPRRTLKHGDTFAVFDSHGDMGASAGGPDGLFDHDTRFLSRFELLIDGMQPLLLGSSVRDDNLTLTADLTNPDVFYEVRIILPRDTLHIVRTAYLWKGVAHQRIAVGNHGETPVAFTLSLSFGNDFADLFEVRGQQRQRRGQLRELTPGVGEVSFIYQGLDGVTRRTEMRFDPAPTELIASAATYSLKLAAGESLYIYFSAECHGLHPPRRMTFFKGLIAANRDQRFASRHAGAVETSNAVLNEALCRAMADLRMLITETPEGAYPYAGIPWYSTTFGRDGLLTALQMLWCDPTIAKGVLKRLAAFQATAVDAAADAEPGKIVHEMRGGEMAALKEVPFGLYYGSVDATPLFVILLGLYVERTGDEATLRELWPAVERALHWMDSSGDRDGDGFLEYSGAGAEGLQQGLRNQGWKDSFDAVFHADGELARGPIALCEVQGYAYAARKLAAQCARRLGRGDMAEELEGAADRLAERFEDAFWCEDLGLYAIALDGQKKPCRVRSSNAGHLLWTGVARPDRARRVADAMISPDFFSGWGVRTIAKGEPRYNPMSYHDGSIWPHDNALIALGLSRYGFKEHADKIFEAAFAAASYMDLRRLPELYCGFRRRRGAGPTLYPVACSPQAWASGALFLMLQATLGLEFAPDASEIRFRNPRLPASFDRVILRQLGMSGASVDIELRRSGGHVSMRVLRNSGAVQVSMIVG
ncbi:amylo-alpha-1,6-glucosidase [Methylocapsa sp. S129]|uniref:amylo-alpha-1,6-glucosidase n=1 Tax=Methylocapsa sp. S129 TaxID=1641869 RepID=UPI00131C5FDE|nr:amylo-alpha-1,6-glucosidase [Methylocapsa sp. S129]